MLTQDPCILVSLLEHEIQSILTQAPCILVSLLEHEIQSILTQALCILVSLLEHEIQYPQSVNLNFHICKLIKSLAVVHTPLGAFHNLRFWDLSVISHSLGHFVTNAFFVCLNITFIELSFCKKA